MPANEGDCSSDPANSGVSKEAPEPFYRVPTEEWADRALNNPLWQPSEEWNRRRAKQKERRGNGHKQEVLHHVGRERRIIKSGERRAYGYPERQ